MIIIRKFQPADFPWIIDIERKVFNEHDPYLYMKFYENYPDTFIVAQINGMIVGYVAGFQAGDGVGRIFSLAVHPLYQRRKIGNSLLNEIIHVFTEMHIKEMILEVRWSNIVAKKFYQKLGFFQYGIAEKYYNNAEDACLMKLRI
ncbi:MAG: ribosomal protein S18-alanine N-acetyltransferase [Candidatus Methanoperedens sp.]|nr:ribosomal protein S18-alanine N-acetyltransferase [Candidatus Methanoperedens sp.]